MEQYIQTVRRMIDNPIDIQSRPHQVFYLFTILAIITRSVLVFVVGVLIAPLIAPLAARHLTDVRMGSSINAPVMPNGIETFTTESTATSARAPTNENPFMNYQLDEITNKTTKPDEFAANNATLRPEMETKFAVGHIDNEDEIWGRKNASYAFYTIAGNSPVRDPDGAFQNWLYGRSFPTCREDVRFCAVKPPRTETPNENGIQDRTVAYSIGLDMNTSRRVAAGQARGIANLE